MENNVYTSPESNLHVEPTAEGLLAGRWSRLWASMIDGLTMIPFMLPLMYYTGGFDGIKEGVQPSFVYSVMITLVAGLLFFVVHGKFMLADGQTLGKKALGIKIVTIGGHHADALTLAKRYGFYWFLPLIPVVGQLINLINILFVFSKSKRCLHDHSGGTKVIDVTGAS